eukprot:scaffold2646_cov103-Isochrysis_galbana.AAC.8
MRLGHICWARHPSVRRVAAAMALKTLTLTACFTAQLNPKPHPCLAAWEKRLPLTNRQWKIIASRYNNSLLTPRGYHLQGCRIRSQYDASRALIADIRSDIRLISD